MLISFNPAIVQYNWYNYHYNGQDDIAAIIVHNNGVSFVMMF